jgi:outer membrane receptor for Fe3+-dicitrate
MAAAAIALSSSTITYLMAGIALAVAPVASIQHYFLAKTDSK